MSNSYDRIFNHFYLYTHLNHTLNIQNSKYGFILVMHQKCCHRKRETCKNVNLTRSIETGNIINYYGEKFFEHFKLMQNGKSVNFSE